MPRDISFQGCDGRVVALLGDGVLVFDRRELVPRTQRRALGLLSRLGLETEPQRREGRRQVRGVRVVNSVEVRRRRRGRGSHRILHGPQSFRGLARRLGPLQGADLVS